MKPLLSILIAVIIAVSGLTVAFAEETREGDQTVDSGTVSSETNETNQPATEDSTEDSTESVGATQPTTQPAAPKNGVVISKSGKYKLYVYNKGNTSYADIIKYLGKDKFPATTVISKIDGYKIRQIRSKAFSGLKSLRKVTFMGTYFSAGNKSTVMTNAFYNCKNMTVFTTNSFVVLKSKCVGYVSGKRSSKFTTIIYNDIAKNQSDVSAKLYFAKTNKIKAVYNVSNNNKNNRKAKLVNYLNGAVFYSRVAGKTVKGWKSSNPKVISITSTGKASVLSKGTTTLSIKRGKLTIKRVYTVTTNPYLTINGKKSSSLTVKNSKSATVKVVGRAVGTKNIYINTEYAKFTSKNNVSTMKVKGTRRGSTTIKVKINGVTLSLKVKIEKNPITDETMAGIARQIGWQSQYNYEDSSVMCSAYSFCYAYYQVKGKKITPGSVWCPGGCMWLGGTYTHYSSASGMLKAIKTSLDKNQACVGLLSIGNAYTHYVTFYDYTGSGTSLSDFKILDPWDGNLTTGEYYGYSYGYHVVTIDT